METREDEDVEKGLRPPLFREEGTVAVEERVRESYCSTEEGSKVETPGETKDSADSFQERLPRPVHMAFTQLVMTTLGPQVNERQGTILLRVRPRDVVVAFILIFSCIVIFVAVAINLASRETMTMEVRNRDATKTCNGPLGPGRQYIPVGRSFEEPKESQLFPCWPVEAYNSTPAKSNIPDSYDHLFWKSNGVWEWFLSSDAPPSSLSVVDNNGMNVSGQIFVQPFQRPDFLGVAAVVPQGNALMTAFTDKQVVFTVDQELDADILQRAIDPEPFQDSLDDAIRHASKAWTAIDAKFLWYIRTEDQSLALLSEAHPGYDLKYRVENNWKLQTDFGVNLTVNDITCLSRGENGSSYLLGREDFICFGMQALTAGEVLAETLAIVSGSLGALALVANVLMRRKVL